jgi:hypothetical protein
MALAFGAFKLTFSTQQRPRWDLTVTMVPKATMWFLVATRLFYVIVNTGIAIIALLLRREKLHKSVQVELLPRQPLYLATFKKVTLGAAKDLIKSEIPQGQSSDNRSEMDGSTRELS